MEAGWTPSAGEEEEEGATAAVAVSVEVREEEAEDAEGTPASPSPMEPDAPPAGRRRLFGGVDFSGDMRDPRNRTWLCMLELRKERLHVMRLDPTGRSGLQACLRDSDAAFLHAEAIGLDFPFGLPLPFAEVLMGGPFPKEGWWSLAKTLEGISRPEFL